jgi:secondary thiamine-phosphate synthase enzyme
MEISNHEILFQSKGNCDLIDLTARVNSLVQETGMQTGHVLLFVPGATGGITTIEFESGLVRDFKELWEKLVPSGFNYHHNERWGDGNGHSHLRASLVGPSLTIPFEGARLRLGTWQQVVFIDFDNRPRRRTVVVQLCGR